MMSNNSYTRAYATAEDIGLWIPHARTTADPYAPPEDCPMNPAIYVSRCMQNIQRAHRVGGLDTVPGSMLGGLEFLPPDVFQGVEAGMVGNSPIDPRGYFGQGVGYHASPLGEYGGVGHNASPLGEYGGVSGLDPFGPHVPGPMPYDPRRLDARGWGWDLYNRAAGVGDDFGDFDGPGATPADFTDQGQNFQHGNPDPVPGGVEISVGPALDKVSEIASAQAAQFPPDQPTPQPGPLPHAAPAPSPVAPAPVAPAPTAAKKKSSLLKYGLIAAGAAVVAKGAGWI